ncbi:MAG: glutathione-disulfide reductase [Gammaproteobacteria bacterium]
MTYDYDLFVIGAGSGGLRAARAAAALGARVAVAEERYFGGTCVNVGCVPKKLLVYAAHCREGMEDALGYGFASEPRGFDMGRLVANKDRYVARLRGFYEGLLRERGVTPIEARAVLVDAHTVAIGEARHSARYILIATGAWPEVPDLPGREYAITSNEALSLPSLPGSVVIVGGGYVAVEFAGIFHGLGAKTTLVHRGPRLLRGFDDEARAFLAEAMKKKGIDLRFDTVVREIRSLGPGLHVVLSDGQRLEADRVMFATGRSAAVADLGLEQVGVARTRRGAIAVDANYATSVPSVYAIGDVIDRVRLTPVALAEGTVVAHHLFGQGTRELDYEGIPTAVFSQPALAAVGPTEAVARERHVAIDVFKRSFTPLQHALTGRGEKAFLKLIVERASDRVLAAHMVGPEAPEIIQGIAIAIRAGATKSVFDATLGIHPTVAEEFVSLRPPDAD